MKYVWKERKNTALTSDTIHALCAQHAISPFLAQIIHVRGLTEDTQEYLCPQLRFLQNAEQWGNFAHAVDLFCTALCSNKRVAVWGDYDVDGVTSSALVHHVVNAHGFSIHSHIPKREAGYGITKEGVLEVRAQEIDTILTVDCGISDVEAVAFAKSLGMQVIITDHHMPPSVLPPADAICNPKLCEGVYTEFAGVGVAFIVMAMVNTQLAKHTGKRVDMREVLDLVALGSIADLVPLHGQNRILVKNGLLFLQEAKRVGIRALKEVCNIHPTAPVTAGQVGFSLAPRINAAGRIGHAKRAFELLTAVDIEEARAIAQELNALNLERQAEEERIIGEAQAQAKSYEHAPALVLYGEEWHHGIIGIVASRIVETWYKPTVILSKDGDIVKGSARSINELDLHDALTDCKELFLRFGGHKAAAGMSLLPENVETFRKQFEKAVVSRIGSTPHTPSLMLDGTLSFAFAQTRTFAQDIASLQPFGIKNAEPTFTSPPLSIKNITHFGDGYIHATITLLDAESGITLKAKAWKYGASFSKADVGRTIEIAYSPTVEEYKGIPQVTVKLKDWRWV